ncbi:MAG: single-stranded-DNA-specific exonuclease RecJ [Clostridia bacterium]
MENEKINSLASELKVDRMIAKLLLNRGIDTAEKGGAFLRPTLSNLTDLSNYVGLEEVAERVKQAIDNKEKVVLYGDYDCDGLCAIAILYSFLAENGVDVAYYVPNRHSEGYGLNIEALEKIAEEYCPDLVITVDCGITSVEEAEYVYEVLGFDLVITDHHEPSDQLPSCFIFNPKLSGENAFRDLCGAGVALRLVEKIGGLERSKKFYDIACIATVADVVPLRDDNRIIVYFGLKSINAGARIGIKMLCASCLKGEVTSNDIAFRLAPRINSVGRLGDAGKVVGLFKETDHFLLTCLIDEINKTNETRKELTKDLTEHCVELLENYDFAKYPIIVLYYPYWDDGIVGIVASQVVGMFNRPTILLTKNDEIVKGSGRSVNGVDILECVSTCRDDLIKFGGHKMACGVTLKEENVQAFREDINNYAKILYPKEMFYPHNHAEEEIVGDITLALAEQLEMLEPCGETNPRPTFCKAVGEMNFERIGVTTHVKCKEKENSYIYFGGAENLNLLTNPLEKQLNFVVGSQIFQNIKSANTQVVGISCNDESMALGENFFSQTKYPDESIFDIQNITFEQACNLCAGSQYGHCFVCYSTQTYERFVSNCKGEIVCKCNQIITQTAPYNTCVIDMSETNNLAYFDNIIFLDKPLRKGLVDELKVKKSVKVFFVDEKSSNESLNQNASDCCDNALQLALPALTYAQIGQIFVATKEIVTISNLLPMSKIFNNVVKKTKLNLNYSQFLSAFYIFVDLGIVINGKDGIIFTGKQNKIENSSLYKLLTGENNG